MSKRDWTLYLDDMLKAINKIRAYIKGLSLDKFKSDAKTIDAVARNLEVLGEASKHIPQKVRESNSDIPWDELSSLRNILSHEYFDIHIDTVWEIVIRDLPPLRCGLKKLKSSRIH